MIKYSLTCDKGHAFEAWFQNSGAFDKLAKAKQVTCARCGSAKVKKALMAPSIGKSGSKAVAETPAATTGALPAGDDAARAALRALRQKVVSEAEYVGGRFAEEARRIHEDEAPQRQIYGEASLKDAVSLLEDGIPVLPLPPAPEDKN